MPIRIKYTSKDVFQTLFVVTSAFYLVHFSQLWGCGASAAQGCTRARALAFTHAGGAGDIRKPHSSQHLTVFSSLPSGTSSHHFLHCRWFVPRTRSLVLIQILVQQRAHMLVSVEKSLVIFFIPRRAGMIP